MNRSALVVPVPHAMILGGGGGTRDNFLNNVMAGSRECVFTSPRAVNLQAQNEYASRMTHHAHVESLFLFSMIW